MEQIWYLPNLIALLGVIAVLIWQSLHTTGYERRQRETCQEQLAKVEQQCEELKIENERLQLLLMGAGVRISGHRVDVNVNRDWVGGDVQSPEQAKNDGV